MKAKNFQLIELVKPAAMTSVGARLEFKDQPQLRTLNNRGVRIDSITVYPGTAITKGPLGIATVATGTDFTDAYLVLCVDSYEKFMWIPLVELNCVQPDEAANYLAGVRDIFELAGTWFVDWTKSYVTFGTAPSAAVVSYLFGIRYSIFPKDFQAQSVPGIEGLLPAA